MPGAEGVHGAAGAGAGLEPGVTSSVMITIYMFVRVTDCSASEATPIAVTPGGFAALRVGDVWRAV